MTRTPRLFLAALVTSAALALAACAPSGSATTGPGTAAAAPTSAAPASGAASACTEGSGTGTAEQIKNFTFPSGISVQAGQAISWTNGDNAPHTVTLDDGSCNTQVAPGATVTVTYTKPGSYPFHCTVHPNMTGTLEVKG